MIDIKKLSTLIKNSGLKQKYIANQMGITSYTFSRKVNGKAEFSINQIRILCDILNIDSKTRDDIFFNCKVDK